jgi:ubiquitin carboxyl-terminal hydrolase 4/11/15
MLKKNSISIEDCFESFRTQEKLEKENAWYCPKCAKHQEAFKKMEVYRSPNILIVQLKRFKIKTTNAYLSMLQNKKNDCLIKFENELNMSPFICGPNKENSIYELYAISQHYGSLSSGHYTALCKNKGKWYSFDDESVSKAGDDDIVTKAAYLLFYRRKILDIK